MNAEIVAVGSELLTPSRSDTNSLYLTGQLNTLGVEVVCKSIIGDDRRRLEEAIRTAVSRSEVVILTGGLGPTEDDLTRESVAAALRRALEFRQEVLDTIAERFQRLNRKMADINRRQAYVVEGAEVLPNSNGTAPGQWISIQGRIVILLPGPPREMKPMFAVECLPRLEAALPKQAIRTRTFRIAMMPESDVDQLIAPIYTQYSNPVTTILAAAGDIQVHLRARCATEEEAEALVDDLAEKIEPLLGDRIYTRQDEPLEAAVGRLLRNAGLTVAVAESCTGGLLGQRFTNVPGSSAWFPGGFIIYTNEMKSRILGIPAEKIEQYGPVSEILARAMAEGARERTGADYALSLTGIAGPEGGTPEVPVGSVWIGLAGPHGTSAHQTRLAGDRERIRVLASQWALDLLRRDIQNAVEKI